MQKSFLNCLEQVDKLEYIVYKKQSDQPNIFDDIQNKLIDIVLFLIKLINIGKHQPTSQWWDREKDRSIEDQAELARGKNDYSNFDNEHSGKSHAPRP